MTSETHSSRRASVVVDLGFGDAGKGTVVDFLVRARRAHTVIRFNGGAQAGHNVVTRDGRHHTFAQLGAGTFVPGVRTHLSRFVVVHPSALLVEAARIAEAGVHDALERLTIAGDALVTAPYVQALGRLRELARGGAPHGTTGVGVGETVRLSLEAPELALRMRDLSRPAALARGLERLRERAAAEAGPLDVDGPRARAEREALLSRRAGEAWLEAIAPLARRDLAVGPEHDAALLAAPGEIVLEGAQGVLLDEWRGFHPHTTWSTCTTENALALLAGYDGAIERIGVTRSYATRHGAGPFPTETRALDHLDEPHNEDAGWQGRFRRGWLDLPLLRYALACSPVDALALTHLDRVTPAWRACVGYDGLARPLVPAADPHDLDHVEALGRALRTVTPALAPLPPDLPGWLERALGARVVLTSSGPRAQDKAWR
ncbi:MAG: adenylosuccinate synthetase [Sandaracinaceae bacterium]|nr:adenylosuccinate synthetase [Sandaracinaceae bacterium]